jgi:hypothetical protein
MQVVEKGSRWAIGPVVEKGLGTVSIEIEYQQMVQRLPLPVSKEEKIPVPQIQEALRVPCSIAQ